MAAGNIIYRDIGKPDEDGVQSFELLLLPIDRSIAIKGDARIETIPDVKAWCFYAQGSWTQVNARISDLRQRAGAAGLKLAPDSEIRCVLLSDDDPDYVCEIQMILAN